jgi:integrase
MARGSILSRNNRDGTTTFSIKYRVSGRQVKKAIGPSRREAECALTAALAKVDRREIRSTSQETFKQAADRWLARKQPVIEASTYRDYETHLRLRLIPAFGRRKLRQIARGNVEDYLARLDADGELSRKTINDSLIPLRQILGRAVRDGVIATNPAANADRDAPLELPYERPTMHYLTREQAHRYLDACEDWYRPLAEVLIGAGLRIGEALALEWRDIDWDSSALNISRTAKHGGIGTPKGDRSRSVLIASYLRDILREHHAAQAARGQLQTLVFTSARGTMLDRNNVRRRGHDAALRDAALPAAIRLHDLRHTAATLWLASGESIYFVQQQLGHKDIQTTIDLYGHPDKAAHRDAAERAAGWWRDTPSEGSGVPRAVPRRPASVAYTLRSPGTTGSGGIVSRV